MYSAFSLTVGVHSPEETGVVEDTSWVCPNLAHILLGCVLSNPLSPESVPISHLEIKIPSQSACVGVRTVEMDAYNV